MTLSAFRDKAVVFVAAVVLCLLPVGAALAHLGFAPALFLLGLLAAFRLGNWEKAGLTLTREALDRTSGATAAWAAVAFCLWIAASAAWSPTKTPELGLQVFAVILCGLGFGREILVNGAARRLTIPFLIFAFGALLLLFFEGVTQGALRNAVPPTDTTPGRTADLIDLARGLTALIPGLFAAGALVLATAPHRRLPIALLGLACVTAIVTALLHGIAANVAAVTVGAIAAAAAYAAPAAMLRFVVAVLIFFLLSSPFIAMLIDPVALAEMFPQAPLSWLQRLFIWRNTADHLVACLPFGCGVDYARALSELGGTVEIQSAPGPLPIMPTHPHNVFLQIWLELGLPGVLFAVVAIEASARALRETELPRIVAAGAAGAAAATLVSFLVEASLWQAWRIAAVAIACAGLALALAALKRRPM